VEQGPAGAAGIQHVEVVPAVEDGNSDIDIPNSEDPRPSEGSALTPSGCPPIEFDRPVVTLVENPVGEDAMLAQALADPGSMLEEIDSVMLCLNDSIRIDSLYS
jgi:hypothetical protein